MLGRAALIFISLVACLMIAGVILTPKTVQASCFWGVCIGEDDTPAQAPEPQPDQPGQNNNPQNNGGGFCDGIGGFLCSGICSVAPGMCEDGEPKIGNPAVQDGALSCSANGQAVSCSDDAIQQSLQALDAGCKSGSEAFCTLKEGFCLQNPGACQPNGATSSPINTGGAVFWGVDCDGNTSNLAACADLAKNLKTSCLRDKDGCGQYDEICAGSAQGFCEEVTKDLPIYSTGVQPVISVGGGCPATQPGCPGYVNTINPTPAFQQSIKDYQTATEELSQAQAEYARFIAANPEVPDLYGEYLYAQSEAKKLEQYLAEGNYDPAAQDRYYQLRERIAEIENNPKRAEYLAIKDRIENADRKVKDSAKKIADSEIETTGQAGPANDPEVQQSLKKGYLW